MIHLPQSCNARSTAQFEAVLKQELEALPGDRLQLQPCVSQGSHLLDGGHKVMVISMAEEGDTLRVRLGVFFNSIIAGCSCADDPTPIEAIPEYCELLLTLDMGTGLAEIAMAE